MEYAEFKNGLSQGPKNIYLFEGEEIYLFETGLNAILENFVTSADINYVALAGDDVQIEKLLPLISTMPFLSKYRVVAIREFYPKADEIKGPLARVFKGEFADTIFVIMNTKPSEQLKKVSGITTVSCARQEPTMLVKWVKKLFSDKGKSIELSVASKIVEYSLCDMVKISNEVAKLASYVGNGLEITLEDVESVVSKDTEYKIYELTDFIAKKNFEKAVLILNDMVSDGESPQWLLSTVYFYFRRLFHVMISAKTDAELAKDFKVKEFAIKMAREQGKSFKLKKLKQAMDMLADYDYLSKSGGLSFDTALYLGVFKLLVE